MGWSQSYGKADFSELFQKITGIKVEDLLLNKLKEMGLSITQKEEIVLDEDMYVGTYKGEKIYLSDGRIFQHKLSETYHGDDQGHDHYSWFEEKEIPEVKRIHDDEDPEATKIDYDE